MYTSIQLTLQRKTGDKNGYKKINIISNSLQNPLTGNTMYDSNECNPGVQLETKAQTISAPAS